MVQTVQNREVSARVLGLGFMPVVMQRQVRGRRLSSRSGSTLTRWSMSLLCSLVVSSSRTKLLTCRCYADKVLIETVQKTVESPQLVLLLDIVVDVPVLVTSWGCRGSAVAVHRQVCQLIMAMMSS